MDRAGVPGQLNGGYIEEYDLDLRRNRMSLSVSVYDEEERAVRYEVAFESISRVCFETTSRREAGDRLQLTEIWVENGPESSGSEEWDILISIFDLSHLRVRCSGVSIDGETVR